MSDIPVLQPKHFIGLRTDIKGNAQYINDADILYPCGGVLILHNFSERHQKYCRLPDKGFHVNMICVSPSRKVIAIAETGENPTITIYDASTLKRKKQIPAPTDRGITSKQIECMQFTCDSKSLIVVYGEPDWQLFSFKYDRAKIENTTRANNINATGTVRAIACNPNDPSVLVCVGDIVFRMLAVTENIWRQFGYSKAENLYLRSVAWISQERLFAGTHDGRLLMVENAELKLVFNIDDCHVVNLQMKEDLLQTSATQLLGGSSTRVGDNEITCLTSFTKGFIYVSGAGKVHLFEKESPHKFKKRNVFKLDDYTRENKKGYRPQNIIQSVAISPMQDHIVVTSLIPQLFSIYMWGPDMTRQPEIRFQELGASLHRGPIMSIAVCDWKPIMMTAGREDRTVRVWNYELETLVLNKEYQEDVYGLDLHPTGLYALVGFAGKLRYLTILIDDFATMREFPIRYCAECRFSSQGHQFAAVNGNVIQIYSSISFENILNLKGHNGRVTSLSWTAMDNKMLSCGTEGAVYEWEMETGKRACEVIVKSCGFTGTEVQKDGNMSFAVGTDGQIREIMGSNIRMCSTVEPTGLDCMCLSNSDMMLFVSGRKGTIFSVKLPITENAEYLEYNMHNSPVARLRISYDDKYLISCALDGTLCIWRLVNTMGKSVKVDKDFSPSVDILISYTDLEVKMRSIRDLTLRMCELDTEHAYQVRQIESKHSAKLKEVHEAFTEAIEELKDKNSSLEQEHVQEIHSINMDIANMKRTHDMAIQTLEATYNEKLINEYAKYQALEDKLLRVRQGYDKQLEELADAKKASENSITEGFLQQLHEKEQTIDELKEELVQRDKDHELIKQQIEDDADREIYELKAYHEIELKEEQNVNIKLRAENGIFRKKINASSKEVDELKHKIFTLETEHVKFKNVISDLEKDIMELKKEINERDETIQDKEKRIYDLKKKNQELEKYKFVLEFQIRELKSQIEPRERKIHDQKEQINDMINELENLQKNIVSLELQLSELREKLSASHSEYKREQLKFRQACDLLKQMRTDLHNSSGLIQDPNRLKIALKNMFHKYNADKEFVIIQEEDCDVKNEFQKQRDYLEKTVSQFKKCVAKRHDEGSVEKIKIIDESVELITETNSLRSHLKEAQRRNRQMESILGLSRKYMLPKEAQRKLQSAVQTREEIHAQYQEIIDSNQKYIEALTEENKRLFMKLSQSANVNFNMPDE